MPARLLDPTPMPMVSTNRINGGAATNGSLFALSRMTEAKLKKLQGKLGICRAVCSLDRRM